MAKQCNLTGCLNPIFSHLYCKTHQHLRTDRKWLDTIEKRKNKHTTFIKKYYKPTGELEVFKVIWDKRPHICQECGDILHVFNHSNFHHIIAKSKAPTLRLEESNIRLLCFGCHQEIHFGTKKLN